MTRLARSFGLAFALAAFVAGCGEIGVPKAKTKTTDRLKTPAQSPAMTP